MNEIDIFSDASRELLVLSKAIAESCGKKYVEVEHLLLSSTILDGSIKDCLLELGISYEYLNDLLFENTIKIDKILDRAMTNYIHYIGKVPSTCIDKAVRRKKGFTEPVYPEDIIFEIFNNRTLPAVLVSADIAIDENVIIQCIEDMCYIRKSVNKRVDNSDYKKNTTVKKNTHNSTLPEAPKRMLSDDSRYKKPITDKGDSKSTEGTNGSKNKLTTLLKYGVDLTEQAKKGDIDIVSGRDEETNRLIEILGRKRKSNPCLIGEPGVGKTAIVEGLAIKISKGAVPEFLKKCRIISLDIGLLTAGAKYRGDFEERLEKIVGEVQKHPNIILFFDELHNMVSTGGSEGTLSAGNILKPYLARGFIRCIGSTTNKEYKQYIEKDGALERRFQKVLVEEPSIDSCTQILQEAKLSYEKHHGVSILDEAIVASVELSSRYIADRFLPDKAFDLLDEACSKVKILNAKKIVSKKDIINVLYMWTGIPAEDISLENTNKIILLRRNLLKRVIGQESAVDSVSSAILRSQAGLRDEGKPIASFIFDGPTGVGKTELAKSLSVCLSGDDKNLIRIDMSEYMEKSSVSKLIGSAPGYIGYGEGGQLTEEVRRKPYSVILFDEIEKAHPEVINIFLQVLDNGRLTDSQGRTVDFKNTIIIFTSNLYNPSDTKRAIGFPGARSNNDIVDHQEKAIKCFSSEFSPEFVNRLDEIIVFNKLNESSMLKILDLLIGGIKDKLKDKGISLSVSKKSKLFLLEQCKDTNYGARPLRRILSKCLENEISMMLLQKSIPSGSTLKVGCTSKSLSFKVEKSECSRKEFVVI